MMTGLAMPAGAPSAGTTAAQQSPHGVAASKTAGGKAPASKKVGLMRTVSSQAVQHSYLYDHHIYSRHHHKHCHQSLVIHFGMKSSPGNLTPPHPNYVT